MADDVMNITPLGSGQEVGRSCHVLEFRGMTILLDCGIHPGYEGMNGLPFLDRIEPADIDVLLITHFHLDHAASLPYFTERTDFRGRVFMTHPTKAVLRLLLADYLRLLQIKNAKPSDILYTEAELQSCIEKIELIDYHQTVTVKGLSFYALNAGHVLGACMYWLDMGGRTLLYTGDYSMEDDRHLMAAEVPPQHPDVLVVESTYGVQLHQSRQEREARFTGTVERVVSRGGRCLIPVFALGRAQELLLILDEYWQANPQLQQIPIYYASKMASQALRVYRTYANMMNAHIRSQMDVSNPFHFDFIQNLKSIHVNSFVDTGPSVVFASPGMLQSGVSRQLFDRWASDYKNGVLIAGYAVEHTLAKEIMNQPKEVVTLEGKRQPLNCLVDYVSFSAHVDFMQNRLFMQQVKPKHIVLVHGAREEMGRLKNALLNYFRKTKQEKDRPTITMPPNLQQVTYKFPQRRSGKVMGSLAEERSTPLEGQEIKGVMVTHNFGSKVIAPQDLATFTPLRVGSISSKLHIPFGGASVDTLGFYLREMFTGVEQQNDNNEAVVFSLHHNQVTITIQRSTATVEWSASPANDVIADSVVSLILHAQSTTASIRLSGRPCRHSQQNNDEEPSQKRARTTTSSEDQLRLIAHALNAQFSDVQSIYGNGRNATFEITTDSSHNVNNNKDDDDKKKEGDGDGDGGGDITCVVTVEFENDDGRNAKIQVDCIDGKMANNVRDLIGNLAAAATPIES